MYIPLVVFLGCRQMKEMTENHIHICRCMLQKADAKKTTIRLRCKKMGEFFLSDILEKGHGAMARYPFNGGTKTTRNSMGC